MEKKDWINEYKHFDGDELDAMLEYLENALISKDHTTIEITKWDEKGNRL